ncbi:MAG: flagellar filament capping protein FliD [Candidatus Competibacteraceae bacterium]|nr:flagellar filament capping protein FliD [Candidatus Competibacteraceae bacterium]MCB1820821.1 flagellar filament capping protein FliD [Candidatus Competibacteraceae bacterium]HRY15577.1 flagellar filament capping protein FliD [Candidatus Competibacteraceae bacterium]
MASITSSIGTGSGLDIGSLVSQLVAAEATPAANRINAREAKLQTEFSAIGTFKGALSAFRSSVFSLSLSSTFTAMKATSSNSSLFTATAGYSTMAGNYNIKVNQLAQAHSLELATLVNKDAQFNDGTLKITVGSGVGREIAIDSTNNTLEGIAAAINKAGAGVTATILNNGDDRQMTIKSTATGETNTIDIEVTGADEVGKLSLASTFDYSGTDAGLKQVQAAQDASITIDGSSTETTSSSNIFLFNSGSLSGVSLEVKSVGADAAASTAKLEIGRNSASATDAVEGFVEGFNTLMGVIKSLTSYDTTTEQAGALLGDASVRSVNFQLRRMLGESIRGTSAYNNLSSIGIETQRDGTLKFDSSKLTAALAADPTGVAKLFTGAEASGSEPAVEGLGNRLTTYLDKLVGNSGSLNSRLDTISQNISNLDDVRETLNMRLQKLETRLTKQFSAMDALVGQMSSTSTYLAQQFEAMANLYKK